MYYLSNLSSIGFLPTFPSKLIYLLILAQRFIREGCPNCESFLDLAGHPDSVAECTSQVYEGLITLVDPERSWVAKWQRLDGYVPGVYAVKVVGMVSPGSRVQGAALLRPGKILFTEAQFTDAMVFL